MRPQLLPAKPEYEERAGAFRRCMARSEPVNPEDSTTILPCVRPDDGHDVHYGATGENALNRVWWSWR